MSIQSFGDQATARFFETSIVPRRVGWTNLKRIVRRKLDMIHYASKLSDLLAPPNNRLEALRADLIGFHSIRINDQWRIVFRWTKAGAAEVRIMDYH